MLRLASPIWLTLVALMGWAVGGSAQAAAPFRALAVPPPVSGQTWGLLERDGAGRPVERYLSSLVGGESGTGTITSPSFRIAGDRITFTVCGHDGPGGGQGANYVALIDARKGQTLRKEPAPGNDAVQERSWDVAELHDREVRIELHDGASAGAYAWMGVGRIDAGDVLRVDFRDGLPEGWSQAIARIEQPRQEILSGSVPFQRYPGQFTVVPPAGRVEIPCGFSAERIFLLGGTVPQGKPAEGYGTVEVVYADGTSESFPLMFGFTLDLYGKQLSPARTIYLHRSADPFQHYLVLGPRPQKIDKLVIAVTPQGAAVPRVTAVTCQTEATGENLHPLDSPGLGVEESAWIDRHTLRAGSPDIAQIMADLRRAGRP